MDGAERHSRERRARLLAMLVACCLHTAACSQSEHAEGNPSQVPSAASDTLATVNGQPISRDDLDRFIKAEPDPARREELRKLEQTALLDEVIRHKAIATAAEKALSPADKEQLEAAVANHRDEELARDYVQRHVPPRPVTPEMVERYYRDHPERFGGRTVKTCEVLTAERTLSDGEQKNLARAVVNPATRTDWSAWALELRTQGFPLVHRTGVLDARLQQSLQEAVGKLPVGGVSGLRFVFGSPFVLRVTHEEKQLPKPIGEVAREIRSMLAPSQLALSVEQASQQALAQVKVKYLDDSK